MLINNFYIDQHVINLIERLEAGGAKTLIQGSYNSYFAKQRKISTKKDLREFMEAVSIFQETK